MNVQWYSDHMTKTKRTMKGDMRLIDLVIELIDAKVPLSSRNPDIDDLSAGKARMVLLNKSDLAGEGQNTHWAAWFEDKGIHVVKIGARDEGTLEQVQSIIQEARKEKIERDQRRGIPNHPIRTTVVGIPNVGESTFINSFAGRTCAETNSKPDIAKENQWIRLNKTLELLDTPGILWPRFEGQQVGLKLTLAGSVNDQILNKDELAWELIRSLKKRYPQVLSERLGLGAKGKETAFILEETARVRACLLKGEDLDVSRAAALPLNDFRVGRLGWIMLEEPENQKDKVG